MEILQVYTSIQQALILLPVQAIPVIVYEYIIHFLNEV